ncbi:PLP-dependent aminotransferase family protein [Marinilongibacter aquaticus]|uniref:MocR-like pyridoxine biosynthesis transcription factor PdxR n=1 Tax=Marinilongibacter aquaticus TaxID=2975157 RepID=UPI0021BD50C0|nr:PLP-dependent aminotransferase family protein [Marinilongibacter aquaticus]UBM58561.1 PLP-dependent aminotransferase family protein [Marinilongibacter aquaticus]
MWLDLIELEKNAATPQYVQLSNQLMEMIEKGILQPGQKLPGTRQLAERFEIHRKTIVASMDILSTQGWLETRQGIGTFVAENLPKTQAEFLEVDGEKEKVSAIREVNFVKKRALRLCQQKYHLDDGLPDPRLAPTKDLMRAYKSSIMLGSGYAKFGYTDTMGNLRLRKALVKYLAETRGLKINSRQILITRGVTQALFLTNRLLLQKGDKVAVGELSWASADANFEYHGAELIKVRIDEQGLDTDHLEDLLKRHRIRMLYLTPHHQYPTTRIMPAERRLKLIRLAQQYGFYVFEDDYDFDFHYHSQPIMPLASTDHQSWVFYTGSFTKAISPVFRVGYLVASEEQIAHLAELRRLVDRQGDNLLEMAIAELLELGLLQRALRRNRKIYAQRRDIFCDLLVEKLSAQVSFAKPEGGLSVWAEFDEKINLENLARKAEKKDLYILGPHNFEFPQVMRMGFASSTAAELEQAVDILTGILAK